MIINLHFVDRYIFSCVHPLILYSLIDSLKMNVKKAMDKLAEWNNAGEKLRHHLPSNDEVLHSWLTQLEEFSQDLPFLLQLSSDALKVPGLLLSSAFGKEDI